MHVSCEQAARGAHDPNPELVLTCPCPQRRHPQVWRILKAKNFWGEIGSQGTVKKARRGGISHPPYVNTYVGINDNLEYVIPDDATSKAILKEVFKDTPLEADDVVGALLAHDGDANAVLDALNATREEANFQEIKKFLIGNDGDSAHPGLLTGGDGFKTKDLCQFIRHGKLVIKYEVQISTPASWTLKNGHWDPQFLKFDPQYYGSTRSQVTANAVNDEVSSGGLEPRRPLLCSHSLLVPLPAGTTPCWYHSLLAPLPAGTTPCWYHSHGPRRFELHVGTGRTQRPFGPPLWRFLRSVV